MICTKLRFERRARYRQTQRGDERHRVRFDGVANGEPDRTFQDRLGAAFEGGEHRRNRTELGAAPRCFGVATQAVPDACLFPKIALQLLELARPASASTVAATCNARRSPALRGLRGGSYASSRSAVMPSRKKSRSTSSDNCSRNSCVSESWTLRGRALLQ